MSDGSQTPAVKIESLLERYELTQDEIRKLLRQIEAGLEAHDKRASSNGGHNWGHVGDLSHVKDILNDVKDKLHLTGEYKKIAH